MELCQVEVVVVLVEKLECILLVHVATSKPDTAVISLDWGFSHEKVAESQVLIQLCRIVLFTTILICYKFDFRLLVESNGGF